MVLEKVSQTTPTQAQVVDGYSTSATDAYSCNYINEKFDAKTILFQSEAGQAGTITLNDDSSNYTRIDIVSDKGIAVYYPAKANICNITRATYTDKLYIQYIDYAISGTTISVTRAGSFYSNSNHSENFKTYYVVGYK